MTVSELLAELTALPRDAVVVVNMGRNELANGCELEAVVVSKASLRKCGDSDWNEVEDDYDAEYYEPPQTVVNLRA